MAISILRLDLRVPSISRASREEIYTAALDMSAWADEKGFDSIVLSEHHATDDGYLPSPLAMAGCIIGRTRRIRVSVSALLLPLYDPVKVAEDLAVLDLASGGRIAITAGLGYRPEEYAMFGKDWEGRGKLLDECLEVMLEAFKGEPFEYGGRRVHVTPTPLTKPHPLIFVGGMGKNAARRAARFGLPFQPGANHPEAFELYRSECVRLGVESPLILPPGEGVMTWVSEDPDRTWEEIGPHLLHDATVYAGWQPASQRSAVHSDAKTVADLRAEGKYRVSTPEECLERGRQGGALAAFLHFPLCGGTPPDVAWKSLELYADRVLPHLE